MPGGRRQKRTVLDFDGAAREPVATDALPGSPEKVDVLAARAARRESLFSDRDTDQDECRGLAGRPTAGTGGVNRQTRPAATVVEKGRPWKGRCRPEALSRFGGRLHHYRTRRGLSQEQLARKAGMTHDFVSRLERGTRLPTVAVLLALAGALGLTPDALLGVRPPPAAP
jgi:XRE family transcriptional regulator, regulator of sulfur utilization